MSAPILVVDRVHPSLMELLEDPGVDYLPDLKASEIWDILPQYEVLVIRSKVTLDRSWIDRGSSLKLIARYGSGMDHIDLDYAQSKGIHCINAPEGNRVAVAEQTVGMLLALLSDLPASVGEVRQRIWDRKAHIGQQLSHRVVGLIGYGNVGTAVAERLRSFGCRVMAYDLYKSGFATAQVEEVSLEQLKREADVISLHVPLNPPSHRMINSAFLEDLPAPIILLNLSRGEVVDTAAVCDGLRNGKISAAALDVFEQEEMSQLTEQQGSMLDFLSNHPRVILSPHTGGLSEESEQTLAEVTAAKIKGFLKA